MAVRLDIRERLPEDALVFDNESYDNSIIGVSLDGCAIYSYEKMVVEFMIDNECSEADAMDFIDYNTIRSIPYAGSKAPMVVHTDEDIW